MGYAKLLYIYIMICKLANYIFITFKTSYLCAHHPMLIIFISKLPGEPMGWLIGVILLSEHQQKICIFNHMQIYANLVTWPTNYILSECCSYWSTNAQTFIPIAQILYFTNIYIFQKTWHDIWVNMLVQQRTS